jgi:agmatinase
MKLFHSGLPRTFLGNENDFAKAKAVILPVPYDSTVSYGTGQRFGPQAIIEASRQVELYDIEFGFDISAKAGIFTLDEMEIDRGSPQKTVERVEEGVSEILAAGKMPIVIGGEHSISSGAVKACVKKFGKISVLQIDAHADLRDEYEGTKYNHACVMRRIREMAGTCVQVGVRSMSEEEAEHITKNKLEKFIFSPDFDDKNVLSMLSSKLYVTIDIDGFDPSEVPAVGTPEPGGLHWQQVLSLLRAVCKKCEIVGFDIVELAPIPGQPASDFLCAKLAYKMVGYSLLK